MQDMYAYISFDGPHDELNGVQKVRFLRALGVARNQASRDEAAIFANYVAYWHVSFESGHYQQ